MPLILWKASYTASGVKGLMKEGGTKRRETVKQMIEKAGGKLHSLYYAYGEADVIGVAEFPDKATSIAASLAVNASGMVTLSSTVLIPVEVIDEAVKKTINYRPPGA